MMVSNYRKIPRHMHRRNYNEVTYTAIESLTTREEIKRVETEEVENVNQDSDNPSPSEDIR